MYFNVCACDMNIVERRGERQMFWLVTSTTAFSVRHLTSHFQRGYGRHSPTAG